MPFNAMRENRIIAKISKFTEITPNFEINNDMSAIAAIVARKSQ